MKLREESPGMTEFIERSADEHEHAGEVTMDVASVWLSLSTHPPQGCFAELAAFYSACQHRFVGRCIDLAYGNRRRESKRTPDHDPTRSMPLPDHIASQVAKLDSSTQMLFEVLWHTHEEQMADLHPLRAQNEKYRQVLIGARSEKLPPIQSEVRRVVEVDEMTPDALGLYERTIDDDVAAARTTERRKWNRHYPK
jgi:hypothetical protein